MSRDRLIRATTSEIATSDLAETLVAMANGHGGILRLTLNNRSVEDVFDRVQEALLSASPVLVLPLPVLVDQAVLEITVPSGLSHVFALDGRFLQWDGDNNRPMTPRELRQLFIERGDLSYEDEIPSDATLKDLNWHAVETYAARIGSADPKAALAQRGCLVKRGGNWIPTIAGLLLFGIAPERFVRGAFITAARFAGQQMGDTFTHREITGSLPEQIRQAEAFLLDTLLYEVQLGTSMEHTEQFEYPLEAARELVVNAVAHRDYSIHGDGIRLFLFSDRFEVISPGRLAGPVTVDNIVEERYSRNSIIVQVLSDMGFIERLGYGVDRVIALMEERLLPLPEFTETSGGFRVRLFNVPAKSVTAAPISLRMLGLTLNPRQESALHYLTHGGYRRITNKDLQELFTDVHPETIRRDLADLVSKGLLIKMGQKRGSYYVLHEPLAS